MVAAKSVVIVMSMVSFEAEKEERVLRELLLVRETESQGLGKGDFEAMLERISEPFPASEEILMMCPTSRMLSR